MRSPSASWRATAVRSRARSRWPRTSIRARSGCSAALPARGPGAHARHHGPAGRRQVEPDDRALHAPARARADRRRDHGRPLQPHHARRAARRPHPARRALPRPRRLHPLDGHARAPRRRRRGDAARGRDRRRVGSRRAALRDGRRGAERGRGRRARRHRGARADAGLRRLDPGAQGRRDGDPRRDRRQQGRPSVDRADARRARAGARRLADRGSAPGRARDRGDVRERHRGAVGRGRGASGARWRPGATSPSGARRSCAPSCWRSPPARTARRLGEALDSSPELAGLVDALADRTIDPLTAVQSLLERA